ncbi:5-oxoprolinase subunit PxpA [Colwellia sp. D2M02]|uniref:5-oxoprolinase subunit PxpA n=1 Tax=Colwellia sp. D2M02 TaxID=2841562 RepID=UPI001C09AE11|nr:5-oxoprolinase subunit PxpA [Colwellia sp. D2M02]MBU2895085.1 5-oxoprolinase subunit PxpA [Colwellia sp. D2M02]
MKLNCDLGESFGSWTMGLDEQVMPHIDQANIACGFHAGDPLIIQKTLLLAKQQQVSVGAHPSYPDLVGFGRRSLNCTEQEINAFILYQIAALDGMAKAEGLELSYVKPHGALYNDMMKNATIRIAIIKAVSQYQKARQKTNKNSILKLMIQATPQFNQHQQEALAYDVELLAEAFADRCYDDDGSLLSRQKAEAVHSTENTLKQVKQLCEQGTITTISGKVLTLKVDSICVHGDNLAGVAAITDIKALIAQVK